MTPASHFNQTRRFRDTTRGLSHADFADFRRASAHGLRSDAGRQRGFALTSKGVSQRPFE
jgi:hypothetical protein